MYILIVIATFINILTKLIAQLAEAVEYTDCFSVEGKDPNPKWESWYDAKQSDGEVPVMLELWRNAEHTFIVIAPMSTLAQNGSTLIGPNLWVK